MNAVGGGVPQLVIGVEEGLDLAGRKLEPLIAQRGQRFEGLLDEAAPQLFVGDDLADEQLDGFLRHDVDLARQEGNGRANWKKGS